jgi:hypothetical protein
VKLIALEYIFIFIFHKRDKYINKQKNPSFRDGN